MSEHTFVKDDKSRRVGVYHSQLRYATESGPLTVSFKSNPIPSRYSRPDNPKPDFVPFMIDGDMEDGRLAEYTYEMENDRIKDQIIAVDKKVWHRVRWLGRDESAILEIEPLLSKPQVASPKEQVVQQAGGKTSLEEMASECLHTAWFVVEKHLWSVGLKKDDIDVIEPSDRLNAARAIANTMLISLCRNDGIPLSEKSDPVVEPAEKVPDGLATAEQIAELESLVIFAPDELKIPAKNIQRHIDAGDMTSEQADLAIRSLKERGVTVDSEA